MFLVVAAQPEEGLPVVMGCDRDDHCGAHNQMRKGADLSRTPWVHPHKPLGGLIAKLCPTLATLWTVARQAPLSMGMLQARILEWVASSFSRGSSRPGNQTQVSYIAGRFFTNWATRKAHLELSKLLKGGENPNWAKISFCFLLQNGVETLEANLNYTIKWHLFSTC